MASWENIPRNYRDYDGFVYIITCKETGRMYIGKKTFWETYKRKLTRKPVKKELERLQRYINKKDKDNAKKYRKELKDKYKGLKTVSHIRRESDWRNYWGSCKELHMDIERFGESAFSRRILNCYHTRAECNYYELKEQVSRDVLGVENRANRRLYYNNMINIRIGGNGVRKIGK